MNLLKWLLSLLKPKPPEPEPPSPGPSHLHQVVNDYRTTHGREPLVSHFCLAAQAQGWADKGAPSHAGMSQRLYNCQFWSGGENIAWGYATATEVLGGWVSSPGHKANLLDERWTHVGYGNNGTTWVALFGKGN